jgi:hypothetical protein
MTRQRDLFSTRRKFLIRAVAGIPTLLLASASADETKQVPTATITEGDLKVVFRDNAQSPRVLSGIASLVNQRDAPGFDALDPDSPGASAGLNFEHIICGHKNPNNAFSPRNGKMALHLLPGGKSVMLFRKAEDDPWAMSSTLKYTVRKPHYLDVDFRCVPHDPTLFGKLGYAILFFANYMNDVDDVGIHFRGIERPNQAEKWIRAEAPKGHRAWNQGGTYRSSTASDLSDHNFKLNSWSYDYPRFTKPFYFGRAAKGMVFLLMFNKMHTEDDEIRFSLFKFKLPRRKRPAWDFQYVIRRIETGKEYGFKARLVWKKFVSAEDCLEGDESWAASGSMIRRAGKLQLALSSDKLSPGRSISPSPLTRIGDNQCQSLATPLCS